MLCLIKENSGFLQKQQQPTATLESGHRTFPQDVRCTFHGPFTPVAAFHN